MTWLTSQLKQKVRSLYEPRLGRTMTEIEVEEYAESLTNTYEVLIKHSYNKHLTAKRESIQLA
jgi:hypothetical protein